VAAVAGGDSPVYSAGMTRAWRGLLLVVGVFGVTCGTPKPAEQAAIQVTAVAPAESGGADAGAVADVQVGAPGKLPIRESTPGKVQCETVDCDLETEVCCVTPREEGGSVGRCVAKPAEGGDGSSPCCDPGSAAFCGNPHMTLDRRCDEAADCSGEERCCAWGAGEGDLEHEMCGARCASERCLAGATCLNGNRCAVEDGEVAGTCPLQIKPPKCGGATCGAGEMCCWEPPRGKPRCAASCEDGVDMVFACTSPEQCAPHDCNTYSGMKLPKYLCGGDGFMGGILCQSLKDCPAQLSSLGAGPGAPTVRACAHTANLPPGVRECDYQ